MERTPSPSRYSSKGLVFEGGTFAVVENCMMIRAHMTEIALLPFHNAIFDAHTGFAFWISHHEAGLLFVERRLSI
jgi:hypothetical protein